MSLLSYILNLYKQQNRDHRVDIRLNCKYEVYPKNAKPETFNNLIEGTVVNISSHGLGLVSAPPFSDIEKKALEENKDSIYIEAFSPEAGTNVKMIGEIRWIKNVLDVSSPYSELGVKLIQIKDDTREELLDNLFKGED